jgi:hypothetical protein
MPEVQHHFAKGYRQAGRTQASPHKQVPGFARANLEEETIDEQRKMIKETVTTTCKEVLYLASRNTATKNS